MRSVSAQLYPVGVCRTYFIPKNTAEMHVEHSVGHGVVAINMTQFWKASSKAKKLTSHGMHIELRRDQALALIEALSSELRHMEKAAMKA